MLGADVRGLVMVNISNGELKTKEQVYICREIKIKKTIISTKFVNF